MGNQVFAFFSIISEILFKSFNSVGVRVSLFLYFVCKNRTCLCCGYLPRIISISFPALSSFWYSGVMAGASDLYRLGILLIRASRVASLPGARPSICEALSCKPCNCFLVSQPRLMYCLYRLMIKEETGKASMHSSSTSLIISISFLITDEHR